MVQLEEVEDQELTKEQPGPINEEDYDSADFVDTDSELSDDEDDDLPLSESLSERISALRDILPPPLRHRLANTSSSIYRFGAQGLTWSGKGLWVLSTSALLLAVPFAIAFVEEQAFVEQERELKTRDSLGDAVTPGVGAGGAVGGQGLGAGFSGSGGTGAGAGAGSAL